MKEQKILENIPDSGTWPSYNQVDENGDYSHRVTVIRSIEDIQTIVELEQNLNLLRVTLDHQKTLLVSCEAALSQRDAKIADLETSLTSKKYF